MYYMLAIADCITSITPNTGNSTISETPGSVNLGTITAIVVVVLLAVTLGAVVIIFAYLVTKHCRKTKINDDSEANTSSGTNFVKNKVALL